MGYLDPYVRRRIAALLLVAGVVVAALALASVGPFKDPPTETDLARSALEDFFAAAHDKDFDRVCELLSPAQRKTIESAAASLSGGKIKNGCSAAVAAGGGGALAQAKLVVRDVRVSGSLAAIDTTIRLPGADPQIRTFKLEQDDGSWVISDLGI